MKSAYSKAEHDNRNDRGNVYRTKKRGNKPPERAQVRLHKLAEQLTNEVLTQIR
ncbi:hypothetical protein D3C75_897470 [compost metagenome]